MQNEKIRKNLGGFWENKKRKERKFTLLSKSFKGREHQCLNLLIQRIRGKAEKGRNFWGISHTTPITPPNPVRQIKLAAKIVIYPGILLTKDRTVGLLRTMWIQTPFLLGPSMGKGGN
ncbi:MAG: hypothetical protein CM15mV71_460 [Caudoviricetes sp.]|nr:MAG: hypothetical protein CM15mV71_460 [Caudoviricetes sp.]